MKLIVELSDSYVLDGLSNEHKSLIVQQSIKHASKEPLVYVGIILFLFLSSIGLCLQYLYWNNSSSILQLTGLFIFGFPSGYLGVLVFSFLLEKSLRSRMQECRERLEKDWTETSVPK